MLAARLLRATGPGESDREAKTEVARVIKQVAAQLRNTPAVCRKSHVHPAVIESYVGGFIRPLVPVTGARQEPERSAEEDSVLELLREGAAVVEGANNSLRHGARRADKSTDRWSPRVLKGR